MQGLKTGMYYLRTKPAVNALQFTVDKSKLRNTISATSNQSVNSESSNESNNEELIEVFACSRENGDACMACGS